MNELSQREQLDAQLQNELYRTSFEKAKNSYSFRKYNKIAESLKNDDLSDEQREKLIEQQKKYESGFRDYENLDEQEKNLKKAIDKNSTAKTNLSKFKGLSIGFSQSWVE